MKTIVAFVLGLVLAAGCSSFRAAQLYQNGTEALERGAARRAVLDLHEAARLEPQASEIQNHLGRAYAAAGSHDLALQAFQRAVDLDCENAAAQRNLASAEAFHAGGRP
ncbi:MAG: hypothetical protein VCB42_00430 [Myxococcota bacterium]